MKLKRIMAIVLCFAMVLSTMSFNVFAEESVTETTFVAKIGNVEYTTFDKALSETSGMTGDVTVEIYNKVTLDQSLSGSYDSITFIGNGGDAEIYLDVQGYITAPGKAVAFKDLTLSKSEGGFISNAGFMNVAFGVYDVNKATYTNCTFANGSYASSGKVLYTDCTFYRSHDKYGLWAYGNVDCTVDGCKFAGYRGIKMYAEGKEKSTELTVKNTDFSQVNNKPAIVLTYGESVTLEDNTYSDTGVFELDLDGEPNGTEVTSDVAPTCKNDSGACGVLVDGKIYTTVAQAAEVAISGSTVTLLHDSTETVEFDEGVILDKGNFTAENVTVNTPVAKVGDTYYADLHEAMVACKSGETVLLIADVDLAGIEWEPVSFKGTFDGQDHTISNLTINKPGVSNTGFITSLNGAFKNVTFTNPSVVGGENTGVVAGRAGGSAALAENITVNGTIKVETTHSGYARAGVIVGGWAYGNYKDITVDGGDKTTSYIKHTGGGDGRYVAGIVGHADDVASYENCTVKNITIRGGWLCGGIAGPGPSDGKAIDCAVENVDMGADYSGGMFGWYYGAGTIENGTIKNVAFIDGNSGNGVIGGYAPNDTATVSNVTFENVTNGSVALIDLVAEVNGDSYLDLDSAIAAAQSGDTIVLLRDISKTITLGAKANGVVLDLNGLTHKTNIIIEEGITIAIKNGTIVNNDSSKSAIETKGITTITNVDIQSARHCVRVEGGLTTIKGGNYLIIGSAEMTQHAVNVSDGGEVVIYNGTFTGPMGTGADSGSAVCVQAGSKVTILDGSFTNGMLSTLDVKEGATLKISGGSFDQDPTDYVAENMISVKDTETGLWSVKRKVTPGGSYGGSSVVTKYTLTFETNGGKTVNKITKAMNTIVDLSECTTEKDGYIFDGWYADKDFNNVVTSVKLTKNTTVYAKWTKEAETDKPGTEDKDLFVDVKTDDWFYDNVKYVVKNKLMNGVSEDKFAPNDTLTRAMLVTILYRLESEPETDNVSFTDVHPEEYYANAVSWAKQKGIVNGITETEFAPNSNITREQIATIIHRYADFKGYDVSVSENTNIFPYADAESISEYAVAAMKYAIGSGLIQGKSATTLNPKDNATRAEIAAILQRFIEANKQ